MDHHIPVVLHSRIFFQENYCRFFFAKKQQQGIYDFSEKIDIPEKGLSSEYLKLSAFKFCYLELHNKPTVVLKILRGSLCPTYRAGRNMWYDSSNGER